MKEIDGVRYYTAKEMAKMVGLNNGTIYRKIREEIINITDISDLIPRLELTRERNSFRSFISEYEIEEYKNSGDYLLSLKFSEANKHEHLNPPPKQ